MPLVSYGGQGVIQGSPVAGTVPTGGEYLGLDPSAVVAADAQKYASDNAKIAAMFPAQLAQSRFNQLFPWIQSQWDVNGGSGGSQVGTQPHITTSGVYSPGQIQQQVNTSRANTDRSAAGQMQQNRAKTASSGFGANSPLLMALNNQTSNNALQTNVGNEASIRQNAAQQNAQQMLSGQTEAENQFANRQNEQIKRAQVATGYRSSLLGALAGAL